MKTPWKLAPAIAFMMAPHPGGAAAQGPAQPPLHLAMVEDAAVPGIGADPRELECLALTIYFEGRGEPLEGQAAVAHVALNRVTVPLYPDSVCQVVQQGGKTPPCQFSWWCDTIPDQPTDVAAWLRAREVARTVLAGRRDDPTGGALYYHTLEISPPWSLRKVAARIIGQHVFFRLPSSEDGEHAGDEGMADNVALVELHDGDVR